MPGWFSGEVRTQTITDSLNVEDLLDRQLDHLFLEYDNEVLALLRPDSGAAIAWVDSIMETLTLDQKIGQLFIVKLSSSSDRAQRAALRAVNRSNVGGFLVSRALDPRNVYQQTRELQEESTLPLFITADYERGVGGFSNNLTEWPSNMGIGATRDPLFAAAAGRLTAIEGRAIGVNMVLAPVVDVNNNPHNPIINIRSYGEDPELVGLMASRFVKEAQALGMLTTLKHFPGHGNTSVDTHTSMGTIHGDRSSLDEIELYPYRFAFEESVQPSAVMSAHLWIPAFDTEPLPATFSRNVLHHLLRDTLRFDGLIVTDDVDMGALQQDYSLAERMVNPLLAGADLVITSNDLERSVRALKAAVQDGEVSEQILDRSVRRILEAKAKAGLHNRRFVTRPVLDYLLAVPRGEPLAQKAADKALTLLKNEDMLPLNSSQRVAVVQLSNRANSESIEAAMDLFSETLGNSLTITDTRLGYTPSEEELDEVRMLVHEADAIVISLYLRLRSGRGEAGLYPEQDALVEELVSLGKPVALLTLGNPYAVTSFTNAEALLVAYEQSLASVRTMTRIMLGEHDPSGQLPITVGPFSYGSGLNEIRPEALALSD